MSHKATTRRSNAKPETPVVDVEVLDEKPVEVEGVEVESRTGAGPALGADEDALKEQPTEPAPEKAQQTTAVAKPMATRDAAFSGEFDESDVSFPALRLVQGSGRLARKYNSGTILLGEDVLFPPFPEPERPGYGLSIIPILLSKTYTEVLDDEAVQDGTFPRVCNSTREVIAQGGTLQYGDTSGRAYFRRTGRILALLRQPTHEEAKPNLLFNLELEEGKPPYAPIVIYVGAGAYNTSFKAMFSGINSICLNVAKDENGKIQRDDNGLPVTTLDAQKYIWNWCWQKVPKGNFTVYVPYASCSREETPSDVKAFCLGLQKKALAGAVEIGDE